MNSETAVRIPGGGFAWPFIVLSPFRHTSRLSQHVPSVRESGGIRVLISASRRLETLFRGAIHLSCFRGFGRSQNAFRVNRFIFRITLADGLIGK